MGVPAFLQVVLSSTGRPFDLKSRRLRVGVDVSTWIYSACFGFSDRLGDGRFLTNQGRADLHQQSTASEEASTELNDEARKGELDASVQKYIGTCTEHVLKRLKKLQRHADILVVLDGATPPVKAHTTAARSNARHQYMQQRDDPQVDLTGQDNEQRIKAFTRAGAGRYYPMIVGNLLHACRHACIPFLVSPYEADGQLAYLSAKRLIDLVLTEDSDLVACGATNVLYKFDDQQQQGVLLRQEDVFASTDLLDFSDAMLAVLFVSSGGDYCENLRGIGFKTALQVVRQAFLVKGDCKEPPLQRVLHQLFQKTWDVSNLSADFKASYENKFMAAVLMYRHPVVFNPLSACTVVRNDQQLDPELASYKPYVELYHQHLHLIVGDLIPSPLAIYMAEGWISPRTKLAYPTNGSVELPTSVSQYLSSYASEEVALAPDDALSGCVKHPSDLADVNTGNKPPFEIIDLVSDSDEMAGATSAFETQPL